MVWIAKTYAHNSIIKCDYNAAITCMAVLWTAWIRCVMTILGAQLKSRISKITLDFLSDVFFCFFLVFVLAIFSVLKKCCDYMCRNGGVSNNTEWIGLTLVPFFYREHCPSNIKIGMKDMLFHTHVYFIMPCSYNIRPLYIS